MKNIIIFIITLLSINPVNAEVNQWGMEFFKIPEGEFNMGLSDPWEVMDEMVEPDPNKFNDESPSHLVVISKPFLLSSTEVTQGQWLDIMNTKPGPPKNWERDNWKTYPVTGISWSKAVAFIEEINRIDKHYQYRLPTEAEWEYAARAGSNNLRPFPLEKLDEHAWFIGNSEDQTHPVATKKANDYGLYDMLGNVWEWTNDWYSPKTYTAEKRINPTGPENGRSKVRRGGSFHCPLYQVRPGYRSANAIDVAYSVLGFRLVAIPSS